MKITVVGDLLRYSACIYHDCKRSNSNILLNKPYKSFVYTVYLHSRITLNLMRRQKIDFEGALQTTGAYFHAFHTSGQIGHTCVRPQKLRWPRAPCSLNPSLLMAKYNRTVYQEKSNLDRRLNLNTLSWLNEGVQKILYTTCCLKLVMKPLCCGDHAVS